MSQHWSPRMRIGGACPFARLSLESCDLVWCSYKTNLILMFSANGVLFDSYTLKWVMNWLNKSKGKPPNCTTFVVQFVPGLLTTLLSSGNTPGSTTDCWPKFRIRGVGGGHFLREFKDEFVTNCDKTVTKHRANLKGARRPARGLPVSGGKGKQK